MDLMKKLEKKGKSGMSEEDKRAKMDVLHELYNTAMDLMGGKVKGDLDSLKSVSVMSDDDEGLEEGLELAEELLGMTEEDEDFPEVGEDVEEIEDAAEDETGLEDLLGLEDAAEEKEEKTPRADPPSRRQPRRRAR